MTPALSFESYTLPDFGIFNSELEFDSYVWQPDGTYIVLGRANDSESSVYTELAKRDDIKIYKRPSGGESVILTQNMIVFSMKINIIKLKKPRYIFDIINKHLINSLKKIGIENLNSRGISDISIFDKKILGSAMYLKNNILFYHAVLNVKEDVSLISRYLKHPGREPDYREGRNHNDFVTSLAAEGYNIETPLIIDAIRDAIYNIRKEINLNKFHIFDSDLFNQK